MKKKVNCWFCNEDCFIPYAFSNNFVCPNCDQYNGFNKDGGYNQDIQAQFSENLNSPFANGRGNVVRESSQSSASTILCSQCARNDWMKIKQISAFQPINEQTYDEEIAAYKRHLDSLYRLCPTCEIHVKDAILQQDQLLALNMSNIQRKKLTELDNNEKLSNFSYGSQVYGETDQNSAKHTTYTNRRIVVFLHWISMFSCLLYNVTIALELMSSEHIPQYMLNYLWTNNIYSIMRYKVHFVVTGMIADLIAKIFLTKERIYRIDAVRCILHFTIFIMVVYSDISPSVIALLSVPDFVLSIVVTMMSRPPRTLMNLNISRVSLDSTFNESALSESNLSYKSAPLCMANSRLNINLNQNKVNCYPSRPDSVFSNNYQNIPQVRPNYEDDLPLDLDAISFTSSSTIKRESPNIFAGTSNFGQPDCSSRDQFSFRQRNPRQLITPAKLTVPNFYTKNSENLKKSFSDTSSIWSQSCHSSQNPHFESKKHFWKRSNVSSSNNPPVYQKSFRRLKNRHMGELSDDSSSESRFRVDSTTTNPPQQQPTQHWWTHPYALMVVLIISISTNLLIVVLSVVKS